MSILTKQRLLIGFSLFAIVGTLFAPPIPQDPEYHLFADHSHFFGIPNALNILSNAIFLWIGIEGLYRVFRRRSVLLLDAIYPAYASFFLALVLVALGSSYYHWEPHNPSLAWDRAAMTIAFMSFFSILLAERVSTSVARRLYLPLLLAGIGSIVYWQYGETDGGGDLRAYALVQFLPLLLTPFILLAFPPRYSRTSDIWWMLGWYVLAKFCEIFDHEIYHATSLIGGHSLKHLCAGFGCIAFLRHLRRRQPIES